MRPSKTLATLIYSALPLFAVIQMAPEWRHSPPKPAVEEMASQIQKKRPVREARELMRVVSYFPPVAEGTRTIRDPKNPDDPGRLEFVEGRPGSVVLDGPFEIEVVLPEDCDFVRVKNSLGSKVMIDTRYWIAPKTETGLDGETIETGEAMMGVFMPTARQTLCNWDGKPLREVEKVPSDEKASETSAESEEAEPAEGR